jgi:hypothetical protein
MAIAIGLGFLVGAVGFVPLIIALKLSRKAISAGLGPNVAIVILSIVISLAFYLAMILIFNDANHDKIVPFVLSAAITLIIVAIGYGIYSQVKHR